MADDNSPRFSKRAPVILDTDLGDDVDDTWALVMLLKSFKELDLLYILTCFGKGEYRAALITKLLHLAEDPYYLQFIPTSSCSDSHFHVGIGLDPPQEAQQSYSYGQKHQNGWLQDFKLFGEDYKGEDTYTNKNVKIHKNGVQHMIDIIMQSQEIVTLICIGPLTNIGAALQMEPAIRNKVRIVCMAGSVRYGYDLSSTIAAEYNVRKDVKAAQDVFGTKWAEPLIVTPLDTCGIVRFEGSQFQKLIESPDPMVKSIIDNYVHWAHSRKLIEKPLISELPKSSILFDTVAVYLAFRTDHLVMENLIISINDEGFMKIEDSAKSDLPVVQVAASWKNIQAYKQFLLARLLGPYHTLYSYRHDNDPAPASPRSRH
eukprot:CAMPEP_0168569456 /NCGR_PEP_ID=MMETSP0413-20121227/16166_1 /TAXON_ID=136452 /ORGANISM="Filamoeba nolandi, Strain NC-AS-23-1" /LENGTH=372 /DNA_ID=CAMNT_0008601951 /DNA_START=32 /DNA_END=1150 /DNA_ORIENTATION=+